MGGPHTKALCFSQFAIGYQAFGFSVGCHVRVGRWGPFTDPCTCYKNDDAQRGVSFAHGGGREEKFRRSPRAVVPLHLAAEGMRPRRLVRARSGGGEGDGGVSTGRLSNVGGDSVVGSDMLEILNCDRGGF